MSDDEEEFSFRPARRTQAQKASQAAAPVPLAGRPIPADHPSHALANAGKAARGGEGAANAGDLQKLLLDSIIMRGDDAELLSTRIKQEQAKGGEGSREWGESRAESFVCGVDLSVWPHNKPLLLCAAEYGRVDIVKTLVTEFKCAVNVTRPKDLNTALHCAAYYGHGDAVRALVRLGANTSTVNKWGETPLVAARHGADAWAQGEHRNKNQGPFAVCFDQAGLEPNFEDCIAVLEGQQGV